MAKRKKKKTPRRQKRKLTAAERRAKRERKRTTKIIFINGKQKRVPREPTINGIPVDEFIFRNADPVWLQQNELWELMPPEYGGPERTEYAAQPSHGTSTRVAWMIHAPRSVVYDAFLNSEALADWLPPKGMIGRVHTFDPRVGGRFKLSLIYLDPSTGPGGKTTDDTDTVQGRFVKLVPEETVAWIVEFESDDPDLAGEMKITFSLSDSNGGTEVVALCENIPPGVRLEDNELGCRSSLENLAAFVERP